MGYDCSQKYQPNVTPKPNPRPLPKKCVDLDTRCPEWASEGQCESSPSRLKSNKLYFKYIFLTF